MSSYSLFKFEPLENLPPGIFKLVKNSTLSYLSSERPRTSVAHKEGKLFAKVRVCLLSEGNLLLSDSKSDGELPRTHVSFWKGRARNGCNGKHRRICLTRIL